MICRLAHVFRDATQSDMRLVVDSWSKTMLGVSDANPRGLGPLAKMNRGRYFAAQKDLIGRILAAPGVVARVAAPPDAPEHVMGWICAAPELRILHFLYVSHSYRRFGLASALIHGVFDGIGVNPVSATQWTRVLPCYFEKWRLEYDPYLLYNLV